MINQSDIALGVRYDFTEKMALKLQVDRIRYKDPESIIDSRLLAESAVNRSSKGVTLLSIALDFAF
jgi:hypothetical protein